MFLILKLFFCCQETINKRGSKLLFQFFHFIGKWVSADRKVIVINGLCLIDGLVSWMDCLSYKTIRPKGQLSSKSTCQKMLQNQLNKMYIFVPENVTKLGAFSPPVFMSLCYTFVLHPCVTPPNPPNGHKKTPYKSRRYFENGGRLRIRTADPMRVKHML